MAQYPAFAQQEIDRRKSQTLSSLDVSYDDPDYLANARDRAPGVRVPSVRPAVGGHARNRFARLTRDDLVAFHRTWFVPNNALLAIVGDLTAAEAFAAAEKAFGSWPRRDLPAVPILDPPPPTRRVVVVDRPGSAQTEIRVGQLAVARTHKELVPLDLADSDSRRRGREPAVRRPAIRSRPDVRRVGGLQHVPAERRHHRGDGHASPRRPPKRCG